MKALRATALVTFLVCIVAACGGHATTNTSVLGASARPGTIPVTVTVDISHGKNASSAQRTVKYVSPYAVSLAINTSKFGYPSPIPSPLPSPGYFPYGNSAADCTATQCSLTLSLDPGYYRFALSLYDGKTQTGAVVQTATAYGLVATGVANAINVTLDPTVSSVALISSTPLPFANGLPAKATVNVQFLDGGGHIVPPQVLPSYVFASATAPPGAVSVTPSYLLASDLIAGKAFTISYTGAEQPAGTPVTIAVQTTNLPKSKRRTPLASSECRRPRFLRMNAWQPTCWAAFWVCLMIYSLVLALLVRIIPTRAIRTSLTVSMKP